MISSTQYPFLEASRELKPVKHEEEIIEVLEHWIKDIKAGKEKARTVVLIQRDGEGETIGHLEAGVVPGASSVMGMCSFASQMMYEKSQRGEKR